MNANENINTGEGILVVTGGVALVGIDHFEFALLSEAREFAAAFGGAAYPVVAL